MTSTIGKTNKLINESESYSKLSYVYQYMNLVVNWNKWLCKFTVKIAKFELNSCLFLFPRSIPLIFISFIMQFPFNTCLTCFPVISVFCITVDESVQFIRPVTVKFFGSIDWSSEKKAQRKGNFSWNVQAEQFDILSHILWQSSHEELCVPSPILTPTPEPSSRHGNSSPMILMLY